MLERVFKRKPKQELSGTQRAVLAIALTALDMEKTGEPIPLWMVEKMDVGMNDILKARDQQKTEPVK